MARAANREAYSLSEKCHHSICGDIRPSLSITVSLAQDSDIADARPAPWRNRNGHACIICFLTIRWRNERINGRDTPLDACDRRYRNVISYIIK